jgi:IS5 family transposase
VPDANTIWVFRERLKKQSLRDALFDELLVQIDMACFTARKGRIIDAALVPAPKQRNSRDENACIKAGYVPEEWSENKRCHQDVEARLTKKHGKSHYSYKSHINVDRWNKVIRKYTVTSAGVRDSQLLAQLLDANNSSGEVWADSA